jgi:hypothetical protein
MLMAFNDNISKDEKKTIIEVLYRSNTEKRMKFIF